MRTLIVFVLTVSLAVGSPKSSRSVADSRTPSKFKRFFETLGLNDNNKEEERQLPFQQQFVPCAAIPLTTTTTTPLPFVGPMCPIYPPQQQQQQPPPPQGGGQFALLRPPPLPFPPQPGPGLVAGGTGFGQGGNVNVPLALERPFGGYLLGVPEPYPPPPRPGGSVTGGTGFGQGGNVNVPLIPELPMNLGPFPQRPETPMSISGGTGIGQGGNVNVPLTPELPMGPMNFGPFPQRPETPMSISGGTGIGQGGNVNVPLTPERPFGGVEMGLQPLVPSRPEQPLTGGVGMGQGGNVNYPSQERPIGILVGLGPFQSPPRPDLQPVSLVGGTGIGQGGSVNIPPEQPDRPFGGYFGGGPQPPYPPPPRPGGTLTGGTGIGQGGNVNVPLPPEHPVGPIHLGPYPQRPEPPMSISGGTGIGQGGNVIYPGSNNRPEPIPSPSEHRPVPVQPPPFVRDQVCPLDSGLFPYTPPGFSFANPYLGPPDQQQQQQCSLYSRPDLPPCSTVSTMELLDRFQLRTMLGYIQKAGLERLFTMTNNYTFFVPADPAFHTLPEWFLASLDNDPKLLRAFVLNHFIKVDIPLQTLGNDYLILNARPGPNRLRSNVYFPELPYRAYTIDGAKVILGDILTRNGRLHIVNKIIVPNPPRNAAQYLQEVPEFSNFMSAVAAANMIDLLQGPDPITFFIPFNDAFRDFDLNLLLKNSSALRNFVKYHIVPGTHYSNGLLNGQYLTTLFDKEIRLSVSSDGFTKTLNVVNNVNRVLKADIPLLNGVAHVVGGVMSSLPEFYFYQQMNEFHTLNFGTLKKRADHQVKDEELKT